MKSTWSIVEKSTGDLRVTVEGEAWKLAQDKAFKKIANNLEVRGFRKGKAPAHIVKSMVSSQQVIATAVDDIYRDALDAGIAECGLHVLECTAMDLDNFSEEEVTIRFTCTVEPEVALGDYKELEFEKKRITVTAAEVKAEVEKICKEHAEIVLKEEGTVESGDIAVIDFEGFKDGIAFEGGKGENYELTIGSNTFIPGFEEQLIGMASEETKEIEVTFPEDYQAEELAGQPVVFKVTVHEIKTEVVPAMTDELVKELEKDGCETVEDLEKSIKKEIKEQKTTAEDNNITNTLLETAVNNASVEIPDVMVERECEDMLNDVKNRIAQQGIDFKMYLQIMGQSEADIKATYQEEATKRVKTRLVLRAIANAESLECTDADLDAEFGKLAEMYSMPVEDIKKYIPADSLKEDVRMQKAVDLVKATAKKKEKDA